MLIGCQPKFTWQLNREAQTEDNVSSQLVEDMWRLEHQTHGSLLSAETEEKSKTADNTAAAHRDT